jgi:hypothetical protein
MPIRASDLRRQILRVSPATLVGAALKDLRARQRPTEWLLLVDIDGAYAVLGIEDIAGRVASIGDPLNQPVSAFIGAACPTADVEEELEDAQARLANSIDLLVLRAGEPYGVLTRRPVAAPTSAARLLLSQAASWTPRMQGTAVLGVDEGAARSTATPPPQIEPIPQRSDRYVNTDFTPEQQPARTVDRQEPLQPGQLYFFRLNVGELDVETTIEKTPIQIQAFLLNQEIDIDVVLFSTSFVIEQNSGSINIPIAGPAQVRRRASAPDALPPGSTLLDDRLLFRVRAPEAPTIAELRVSIYYNGMLIQSRLVRAAVGAGQALDKAGTLRASLLDFSLSPSMAPQHLAAIKPHTLSLMLNGDASSHQFRVVSGSGQDLITNSVDFPATELVDLIRNARGALRLAAWGTTNDWDNVQPYRYDPSVFSREALLANCEQDLIRMAAEGARLYDNIINTLAGDFDAADALRDKMRTPGVIQMASKDSINQVVPIAMVYDSLFDAQVSNRRLCQTFKDSLSSGRDLIGEPCFKGECPNRDTNSIVCPSGFWGFRHAIGMPYPVLKGPEMATEIAYTDEPLMDIAFYQFAGLGGHFDRLAGLGFQTQRQSVREQTITMFQESKPQLVYWYCHGVLKDDSTPLLKIGTEAIPWYFDTSNFRANRIRWLNQRPLVIINGCHTTALSPDRALSFVKTFVEQVAAAGVIGTEITIFEPFAQAFSEIFIELFRSGNDVGTAIRKARLRLLQQGNPLGLVYQPFTYAGLKLVKSA